MDRKRIVEKRNGEDKRGKRERSGEGEEMAERQTAREAAGADKRY